jgi:hypothetical protein
MKNTKEITRNYLQFVITVSIFFLAVFPNVAPVGYILIVAYLLCFLVFELRNKEYTLRNLRWINTGLLFGVTAYIIPLLLLAYSSQDIILYGWGLVSVRTALYISMIMITAIPAIIFVMICFLSGDTFGGKNNKAK